MIRNQIFLYRAVISLAVLLRCAEGLTQQPPGPRLAVPPFTDAGVGTEIRSYLGSDQDIDQSLSDLLTSELLKQHTYRIVDSSTVSRILAEQNFSNSDRASGVSLGRSLGADYILVGNVTRFGVSANQVGGAVGSLTGRHQISTAKYSATPVLEITARLINVETGEILAEVTGRGEGSSQASSITTGILGSQAASKAGSVEEKRTSVHHAMQMAIAQLATQLNNTAVANPPSALAPSVPIPTSPAPAPLPAIPPDLAPLTTPSGSGSTSSHPAPPEHHRDSHRRDSGSGLNLGSGGGTAQATRPGLSSLPLKLASKEYKLGYTVAAWKKTLENGKDEFYVPPNMVAQVPSTVTVVIHGFGDTQASTLPEASGGGPLPVSTRMKAELLAPQNPSEFRITPQAVDAVQFVPNDGHAEWLWNVTPTNAAQDQKLEIRISLIYPNGTAPIEQIIEEKTYNVSVDVQKLSVTLRQSFWKDPVAWFKYMLPGGAGWGALAALAGSIGGATWWRRNKKKKIGKPNKNVAPEPPQV